MTRLRQRDAGFSALCASAVLLLSCTYANPEPVVRVTHHVRRPGTDSIVLAVYATLFRQPTGLAAFPDGGRPRLTDERAIFYLCVLHEESATARRLAVIAKPDSIRSGFTPWVSSWDGTTGVFASVRGYTTVESVPNAFRTIWFRVQLTGAVEQIARGPSELPAATSLPAACEATVLRDAKQADPSSQ